MSPIMAVVDCSRPRCDPVRIVDARTYKQHFANLFFPSSSSTKVISTDRLFDSNSTQHLVLVFILSQVDYCNAVIAGLPASTLASLQRMLNATAHFMAGWYCGMYLGKQYYAVIILDGRSPIEYDSNSVSSCKARATEPVLHTCQTLINQSHQCLVFMQAQRNQSYIPVRHQ